MLFDGGITSGVVNPVEVFVIVVIEIYEPELLRKTQNVPLDGVEAGRTNVLNPEFVKL